MVSSHLLSLWIPKNRFPPRWTDEDVEKWSRSAEFLCASVIHLGGNCHTLCDIHILKGRCYVQFGLQCSGLVSNWDSSVFQNQFLSSCCFHILPYVLGPLVRSRSWIFYIFLTTCIIFWHAAHSLRHHHTPLSTSREFWQDKYVSYIKNNRTTNFFKGQYLQRRIYVSPNPHGTALKYNHLRRNKMLDEHKRYRPGNLSYVSYWPSTPKCFRV
jgi:hypothetical protein